MSILEPENISNSLYFAQSPRCPSAPRLKPFSSSSTLEDQQKNHIDLCESDNHIDNDFDGFFNIKQCRSKKPKISMMQFLNHKINSKKNKRMI